MLMNREPYWDYMARRSKEERPSLMTGERLMRIEIQQMQKQVYDLYDRMIALRKEVDYLKSKISIMGGDYRQLELEV